MTRKKWLKKKDQKSSGNIITILHGFYFWRLFLQSSKMYVTFLYMVYSYIYLYNKKTTYSSQDESKHISSTPALVVGRRLWLLHWVGWRRMGRRWRNRKSPRRRRGVVGGGGGPMIMRSWGNRGGTEGEEGRRSFQRSAAGAPLTLTPWRRAGDSRRGMPPRWQASSCAPPLTTLVATYRL